MSSKFRRFAGRIYIIRAELILEQWDELLRIAGAMIKRGWIAASGRRKDRNPHQHWDPGL